jgi:hypothetical protein
LLLLDNFKNGQNKFACNVYLFKILFGKRIILGAAREPLSPQAHTVLGCCIFTEVDEACPFFYDRFVFLRPT